MIGQEMRLEMALTRQREDEEELDLRLSQQIGSIDLELKNES
jgi:hypothetical protein